jgi:hypothetical protein
MRTCGVAQSFKFVCFSIRNNDGGTFFEERQAYSASQSTGASGH